MLTLECTQPGTKFESMAKKVVGSMAVSRPNLER